MHCINNQIVNMNNKNHDIKKILKKFEQLKSFDSDFKKQTSLKQKSLSLQVPDDVSIFKKDKKESTRNNQRIQKQKNEAKNQIIYTQSEISREVAKLKPYLAFKQSIRTTEQLQELRNKQVSQQNYKMMSDLAILENRKLCQLVDEAPEFQDHLNLERLQKQNEGWIFQIFYRSVNSLKDDISRKIFLCGYAVMTDQLQIYESLTFQKKLITISPSSITMVRYEEDSNYEIITIEQGNFKVQCGFLNTKKFELFDRMLFLQKNMSRSTSTRLFQNQLIRSIYNEYERT